MVAHLAEWAAQANGSSLTPDNAGQRLYVDEETGEKTLANRRIGSGKPRHPEKRRLAEIIDKLNDLLGAEVSHENKLHFANGMADRIERDEGGWPRYTVAVKAR